MAVTRPCTGTGAGQELRHRPSGPDGKRPLPEANRTPSVTKGSQLYGAPQQPREQCESKRGRPEPKQVQTCWESLEHVCEHTHRNTGKLSRRPILARELVGDIAAITGIQGLFMQPFSFFDMCLQIDT